MTDWIEWNGGECPIKSDKTMVEVKLRNSARLVGSGKCVDWRHSFDDPSDIMAYRITEDHEPVTQTREQITAQIAALQKQLDALPPVLRRWYGAGHTFTMQNHEYATHYFDIETINGVPHIHGVAMKEVVK